MKHLILQAEIEDKGYDIYSSEHFYVNANEIARNGIGHTIIRPPQGAEYSIAGNFFGCLNYFPLCPFNTKQFSYSIDSDNFLVILGLLKNDNCSYMFNPKISTSNIGSSGQIPRNLTLISVYMQVR